MNLRFMLVLVATCSTAASRANDNSSSPVSHSALRGGGDLSAYKNETDPSSISRYLLQDGYGEVGFDIKNIEVLTTPEDGWGDEEEWRLKYEQTLFTFPHKSQMKVSGKKFYPREKRHSNNYVNIHLGRTFHRNAQWTGRWVNNKWYAKPFVFYVWGDEDDQPPNDDDPIGSCYSHFHDFVNRDIRTSHVKDCGCAHQRCYKVHYEMYQNKIQENPCNPNPCKNSGICQKQGSNNFECFCKNPYTGRTCDKLPTPPHACDNNPCRNGGVCQKQGSGYQCFCPSSWRGRHCTDPVTPQIEYDCKSNTACRCSGNGWECPSNRGKLETYGGVDSLFECKQKCNADPDCNGYVLFSCILHDYILIHMYNIDRSFLITYVYHFLFIL